MPPVPTRLGLVGLVGLVGAVLLLGVPSASAAQAPVGLGTADSFAVLAGTGITNTGPTTIIGDVGTFPTPAETGFATVTLTGTNHGGDAVTQGAKNDLVTAYVDAAGRGPVTTEPTELGGLTLGPGTYGSASGTFGLTGTVTLDGQGNPASVFVFQTASTLITASGSRVLLINGADPCHVVWQVGSSATLGTDSSFVGDLLALTSITAQTGTSVSGRLLARNGAVTLDTTTIDRTRCAALIAAPPATAAATPTATPTATVSATPTPTGTVSATATATDNATPTATATGTVGATPTATTIPTATPTGQLPFTGSRTAPLTGAGLALLALGGLALVAARRRPHRGAHQRR